MPAPVLPMTASVSPAIDPEGDVVEHRLLGAGVAEVDVAHLERRPQGHLERRSRRAPTTLGGVSSTSLMRAAHTAARGHITATKVAIMTAVRIWIR